MSFVLSQLRWNPVVTVIMPVQYRYYCHLKLLGTSEEELGNEIKIVKTISNDIRKM
jgi:hypothetical protein